VKIGFTGTREGMSQAQKDALHLALVGATEFHHGDCIGADAEADVIARCVGVHVVIHPPSDPKLRAFCYQPGDGIWATDSYLNRDWDIVRVTDCLIAAPLTESETPRSGTWATVRMAREADRPIAILAR
jgi:hypothetical protein